jgi:hypothetical protein
LAALAKYLNGERVDSGIEFKIPAVPKPFKKRRW